MTIHDVIKWCDEKSQDGKEVVIHWEGGGDSGWVYLQVDGENTNSDEADWLIDKMHDELDYGSWAGEYSANGQATYDPATKTFTGTDYYSEDDYETYPLKASIYFKIPKKYYFEKLSIELDDIANDYGTIDMSSSMDTGFVNEPLENYLVDLSKDLARKIRKVFDEELPEVEYSGWQTIEYDEQDVLKASKLHPDHYLFVIEELDYRSSSTRETGIEISLEELAEHFKNSEL